MKVLGAFFGLAAVAQAFGGATSCPKCECPEPASPPPLQCANAEPQSPRDVTAGSPGILHPRQAPLMSAENLIQVNTHFHLGAEHMSSGEYDQVKTGRRLLGASGDEIQAGFFCADLPEEHLGAYEFEYCDNVQVGNTYEIHWVNSSAGIDLGEGLGGAFARNNNPIVLVLGQVLQITSDESFYVDDLMYNMLPVEAGDMAAYMGSTTGPSFNNEVCSPYTVNWNVDTKCRVVSAKAFDQMCKDMKEKHEIFGDAHPHGSRVLVAPEFSADELISF